MSRALAKLSAALLLLVFLAPAFGLQTAADWVSQGNEFYAQDKCDDAIRCYEEAINIDPKFAEAWNNKGVALVCLSGYTKAIECFDAALKIKPRYANAWNNMGVAYYVLCQYEYAIELYNESLAIHPENFIALINKGWALIGMKRCQEAASCFQDAIVINPSSEIAWYGKGCAFCGNGSYNEAIGCYDEIGRINPRFAEQWNGKGLALHKLERYDDSLPCLNKSLEINPQYAEAWNSKGLVLFAMGRYEEAVECYNKSIGIEPGNAEAWANKGAALADLDRYEAALECYDKALSLYPFYASVWQKESVAYGHLGEKEEAKKCLNYSTLLESTRVYPSEPPKSYLNYHLLSTEPPEEHPLGPDAFDFNNVSNLAEINESQSFFRSYYELDIKLDPIVEEKKGRAYLVGILREDSKERRFESLGGFFMPSCRQDRFDVGEMAALAEYYLERSGIRAAIAVSVNLTSLNGEIVTANETTSPAASFRHAFVLVVIPGGPYILDPSRPDFNESMIRIIGKEDPEYHKPYYRYEWMYNNIYEVINESHSSPKGWLLDQFDWWNSAFFREDGEQSP